MIVSNSTYVYAKGLYERAKYYNDMTVKASQLKKAWDAAYSIPADYRGRTELINDIEQYAYHYEIDLDEVSE